MLVMRLDNAISEQLSAHKTSVVGTSASEAKDPDAVLDSAKKLSVLQR